MRFKVERVYVLEFIGRVCLVLGFSVYGWNLSVIRFERTGFGVWELIGFEGSIEKSWFW